LRPWVSYLYPGLLFQDDVILMAEEIKHQRQIYGALDLLGDLGGVYEIIIIVLSVYLLPISKHSFTLKATKKLFRGRTRDPNLFKKSNNKEPSIHPTEEELHPPDEKLQKEQEKNKKISLRLTDSILLYFSNSFLGKCLCLHRFWKNQKKF